MMPTPDVLRVSGLVVELKGQVALSDVSFTVREGECVGIVGETGSGKTLTCRVIAGLIQRIGGRIVGGEVDFQGVDLGQANREEWRALWGRKIGYIPQASLAGLDPVMRVGRQLDETIRQLDPEVEASARSTELLELVHMRSPREVKRLYPHELSGGMRQRVMIALALAGRPQLIIADEPTTALDVTVQRGILTLLAELRRSAGMTVVIVTHDLAVVQEIADSVVVMYAGKVVESGQTGLVLSAPGHPYTRALLAARPILMDEVVLSSIPGAPPSLHDRPPGCPFAPRCAWALPSCSEGEPPLEIGPTGAYVACFRKDELT